MNKLLYVATFALILFPVVINGNIGEWDEVWTRRAKEAWNRTLESFESAPQNIISHFNLNVNRALKEVEASNNNNRTRRRHLLGKYKGPCVATNPIDRCWRCNPRWAQDRFKLAECALGFGYKATGGKDGRFYTVTDPSDNDLVNPKPGTLRHAVIQNGPLWIVFARSMVISLTQELIVQSDKTIDGRGAMVEIAYGAGITIQYVRNVIIHGVKIHDIVNKDGGLIRDSVDHCGKRGDTDGDGITIFGSQDVWIDHVSMTRCSDGLIDVVHGSTGVTLSNNHFTDHNKTMLFGHSDSFSEDKKMQITVAFNHFGKRLVQRMPRCRFGYIHVVNNDYTHWKMYAIGGSSNPIIISQGNRYIAESPNAKQVTKREKASESEWKSWTWISQGDQFLRGAYFVTSGDQGWFDKHPQLFDRVVAGPATFVSEMTKFAGQIKCIVGRPC